MSSITSQSIVFATAMAVAISGTFILLVFRHHKPTLRPCLSSSPDGLRRGKKKSSKKVRFADDVVEPRGNGVEFRKQHRKSAAANSKNSLKRREEGRRITGMPENRVALYNGMLRDKVGHRLGYSY